MTWTRQIPTVAGWYFWRAYPEDEIQVVKVEVEGSLFFYAVGDECAHFASEVPESEFWSEPLKMPCEFEVQV